METCSEEDQNIEMPRDHGLMEEFQNKSFYHYFNDTFKEENVNKEGKRPPANSGFDFRAGSSLRNEHRGSKTSMNHKDLTNEFHEMTVVFSDCLGTRNTKIDLDRFIDLASKNYNVSSKVDRKRLVKEKKKSLKCEKCGEIKWSARFMFRANGEDETILECSKCDVT